ncbi:glycosyltransferase family 4 protein [Clostridium butyricum]|uniref:glycosyltransferase family 4 protein n=1 Tax=Clostridium butyricum TaxID=1492 RepID=UPI003F8FC6B0
MSRILLNGLHYEKNGAGISRYTHMLLKTFIEENYDVDILVRKQLKNDVDSNKIISSKSNIIGSKDRIIYEQLKAKELYKNYELVHFPDYATPVLYQGKKVATIHDLAMHTMRDRRTFMQNITKNIFLKHTINHSDKLICVSEFAKKELLNYYPKVEKKIEVIYEGVEIRNIDIHIQEERKILHQFNINNSKYILYVGTIAPHKNIKKLIQGFNYITDRITEYKLVIAGGKGWMYEDVFEEVIKLNLQERIVFTNRISDIELEVLYKNAEMFISVSLYEGFGFPPLEAMARKVPVIVSDIEIFKETCGECALYCNPNEIEDIGNKIMKIVDNKVVKNSLIEKASERVKTFNWKETAKKTYDVYCEIL